MADFHFELVTPEQLLRSVDVQMVVVPGSEGEFGVMAGHAPYMAMMRAGDLAIYSTFPGEPERIAIQGGFAEVNEAGLTVLALLADN